MSPYFLPYKVTPPPIPACQVGAEGLDFGRCALVVLFDLPGNVVDYVQVRSGGRHGLLYRGTLLGLDSRYGPLLLHTAVGTCRAARLEGSAVLPQPLPAVVVCLRPCLGRVLQHGLQMNHT